MADDEEGRVISLAARTNESRFTTPERLIEDIYRGTTPEGGIGHVSKIIVILLNDRGEKYEVQLCSAGGVTATDKLALASIIQHDALVEMGFASS